MKLRIPLLGLLLICAIWSASAACDVEDDPRKHWHEREMDTAWLSFIGSPAHDSGNYVVRFVSHNCFECAPSTEFVGNTSRKLRISSQHPWTITLETQRLNDNHEQVWWIVYTLDIHFKEFGRYNMSLSPGVPHSALFVNVISSGTNSYFPIITALSLCVAIAFLVKLLMVLIKRRRAAQRDAEVALAPAPKHNLRPRLRSLDAFRGFALFFMVFVNYGGGGYWFFNHATWNGITFADLLFPWFVWIMGAAMPFAMAAAEKKKTPRMKLFLQLLRRSLTLAALGMFLNNGHYINYWRLPGVLQRFGLAYFVIGTLYIFMPKITAKKDKPLLADSSSEADMNLNAEYDTLGHQSDHRTDLVDAANSPDSLRPPNDRISRQVSLVRDRPSKLPSCCIDHFSDIFPFVLEYTVMGVFILAWFLITFSMPVPGCPKGYLGPGGRSGHEGCTGGAAGYIDRKVFTLNHIFDDPTCKRQGPGDVPTNYGCSIYDPEGLLGNLTSFFLCYLGLQAGRIMKTYQTHRARFIRLALHGLIWAALGTGLCGASQNGGVVPLNKNLWSFSFVALLGGLAYWLLALFFLLIDWIRIWKGTPFTYVGMNSIVVYMGHEILEDFFPFSWSWMQPGTCAGEYATHWVRTTSDLGGASIWLLISYILFKKKIFIRV